MTDVELKTVMEINASIVKKRVRSCPDDKRWDILKLYDIVTVGRARRIDENWLMRLLRIQSGYYRGVNQVLLWRFYILYTF